MRKSNLHVFTVLALVLLLAGSSLACTQFSKIAGKAGFTISDKKDVKESVEETKVDVSEESDKNKEESELEETKESDKETGFAKKEEKSKEPVKDTAGDKNKVPEITKIVISEGTIFTGAICDLQVIASDPDGDILSVKWYGDGGTISDVYANPTVWNVPDAAGAYTIKVAVSDGRGGEASAAKTVNVVAAPASGAAVEIANLGTIVGETSSLMVGAGAPGVGGRPFIGDMDNDGQSMAYISFDITALAGSAVDSALLNLLPFTSFGDPFALMDSIVVDVVDWGDGLPDPGIFASIAGTRIQEVDNPEISCSSVALKTELQRAIDEGRTKFKLRIYINPQSDFDRVADGWVYDQDDINLHVEYIP